MGGNDSILRLKELYYGTGHSGSGNLFQLSCATVTPSNTLCFTLQCVDPIISRPKMKLYLKSLVRLLNWVSYYESEPSLRREKSMTFAPVSSENERTTEINDSNNIGRNTLNKTTDDNYDGILDSSSMQEFSQEKFELIDILDASY